MFDIAIAGGGVGTLTSTDAADRVALADVLDGLGDDRRDAFVLTQVLGMHYDEAAEVLGCPVGTIRSRVARARLDLVEMMTDDTMTDDTMTDDTARDGNRRTPSSDLTLVNRSMSMARSRLQRGRFVVGGAAVALAVGLGACAGDSDGLSEIAKRGKDTAVSNCASCHGVNGQGGVGPTWIDLAGSDVELEDGTIVVADDEYLIRSILEPDAEDVAGYTIAMPANGLSEAQATDVVAYIKELTTDAP